MDHTLVDANVAWQVKRPPSTADGKDDHPACSRRPSCPTESYHWRIQHPGSWTVVESVDDDWRITPSEYDNRRDSTCIGGCGVPPDPPPGCDICSVWPAEDWQLTTAVRATATAAATCEAAVEEAVAATAELLQQKRQQCHEPQHVQYIVTMLDERLTNRCGLSLKVKFLEVD
jgi:hypothetical protein